jgi:hypothetical protein
VVPTADGELDDPQLISAISANATMSATRRMILATGGP